MCDIKMEVVTYRVYGKSPRGDKEYLGDVETKEFGDDWQFNNAELVKALFNSGYIDTNIVDNYYFEDNWDGNNYYVLVYPNDERNYWSGKLLELERC